MTTLEEQNGIHTKSMSQVSDKPKSTADKFAEHFKVNWDLCSSDKIVDVNKRGRYTDITTEGKFKLKDDEFTE